ncbi:ABC transporter permease [Synechococcus sp. CS-1325]|uniref:ABC transporter permease n=1 Tax=unclassified Synechococcus TaxID=2626047 RepID=UPI000DB6A97A|nr:MULTISPECIES: ABC transporter permease [unclassified Synechococcus]MCT0199212.1 ABC transporter permease [Synechococcus sp. CS-1325]MCT0214609.1 ABC transporter permease [Synechococcus sp. CS-1326]MCT0233943.1 ABC transporter permease [Synechococcus sp. CS-1327]PZV02308.1 MAG: sugar ABC transporter permease [Cyanobium sp.]
MGIQFQKAIIRNRELIWRLIQREVQGRYRGSVLGLGWSFVQPLAMLAVYTLVFSQVFKARWGNGVESGPLAFAVNLFAGLIVFNLFAECVNRAPGLILANPNYVKKVVFPLEVLPPAALGTAGFHAGTSVVVLIIFEIAAFGRIPSSIIWLPVVWIPLLLGTLAVSWVLSAVGVFLRDIGQLVGVVISMLMFLSPIFFPLSALPPRWLPLLNINPLAHIIEQTRMVAIIGKAPSITYLIMGISLSLIACELSYRTFQRAKPAFADVI